MKIEIKLKKEEIIILQRSKKFIGLLFVILTFSFFWIGAIIYYADIVIDNFTEGWDLVIMAGLMSLPIFALNIFTKILKKN